MSALRITAATMLTCMVAACGSANGEQRVASDSVARARQDSINRAQPGYVVDSILPVEEEIRRFSAAVGGTPVTALQHASASREELVKRIIGDVVRADSADLVAVRVTPREFIDLMYPSSPFTHPPYRQAPGLVWMQIDNPSVGGLKRLLRRAGGVRVAYLGHTCDAKPERQGPNTLWSSCSVRLAANGDTVTQRWFGTILEREGRFKLLSYKNQF